MKRIVEKRHLKILLLCLIALIFVNPQVSQAQESVPLFKPSTCPIEVPDGLDIDCGYLIVPEDYDHPDGITIHLPVIIIHSRSANPAPDPVLYTEGGPGYSSLGSVWRFANSSFLDHRDIVILEQRGNRYADPSLECDISVWEDEREGHTPCLDSLRERGIDLTHYTTQSIVADIDALRGTLDYDEWNLFGSSYSTRLMQLTMRDYPEGIRSVILQSVSRLDETRYEHDPEHAVRALKVMFTDCAADPECAMAYPDLENRFYELFSKLNADPIRFEITLPAPSIEMVDGYRLLGWMVTDAFYGPAYLPATTAYLPLLIDQVEKAHTDLLYPWLEADKELSFADLSLFNWGLFFSVNCQDDGPSVTHEQVQVQTAAFPELEGYMRQMRELEICDVWDLPAAPPLADEPVMSDIPTLVLAGSYDPITPPVWSKAVADNLSSSFYYEFPSSGHNIDTYNPCAERIKSAFINDPSTAPDTSCMTDVPNPEFVLPQDVIIMEGLYRSLYEVSLGSTGGEPLLEAIFATCTLLLLAELIYILVAGIAWILRRGKRTEPIDRVKQFAHPLAGLVVVLNMVFFAGWSMLVYPEVSNNMPLILRFGVPAEYAPLFILPAVTFALTVSLVIITLLAWIRRYWSLVGRIFFSLVTLAAVGFVGFMIRWDVLTALF
jgi:pimeloyl-ACP methyl ester carboxylesterase